MCNQLAVDEAGGVYASEEHMALAVPTIVPGEAEALLGCNRHRV